MNNRPQCHCQYIIRRSIVLCLLAQVFFLHALSQSRELNSLAVKIKLFSKDAIFHSNDSRIGYSVKMKNEIEDNQRGSMNVNVINDSSVSVFHDNVGIFITAKSSFEKYEDFDRSKFDPGIYTVTIVINTNHYYDSIRYIIAVEPEKVSSVTYRPSDFQAFWEDGKRELYNIDPQFSVVKKSDLSTQSLDVYYIEFQSVDNIKSFAWLSIPNQKGKFPVLVKMPEYKSEVKPDYQREIAVMTIGLRSAGNVEYLISEINSKQRFIYRGVYLDCLRGLDFIYRNTQMRLDTSRVIVSGIGQGAGIAAAVAALDGRPKGVLMEKPLLLDIPLMYAKSAKQKKYDWPVSVFQDYVNTNHFGVTKDLLLKTWTYFDPVNFSSMIKCPVLAGFSLKNNITPPQCVYTFMNQLRVLKKEVYTCADCINDLDKGFYQLQNVWMKEVFRVPL